MKVIDMHCDTIWRLFCLKEEGRPQSLRQNDGHLDLVRMKESGCLLQNFALFVARKQGEDPWEQVCRLYECYREEMDANADRIAPVLRYEQIAENEAAGKLSALLTVEEGAVCKGEPEKLRRLYEMGVRMMTLTWNYENELGHPNFDPARRSAAVRARKEWEKCPEGSARREELRRAAQSAFDSYYNTPELSGGLTETGRAFVEEMERLGMIPDVSHLSDAGFYDVLEVAKKPFAASHSNARAVCPCVRNLTDDMIRRLAERGGVMGLNYCPDFLEEKPLGERNPGTLEAVVRHARHILNVGGREVLGLGSDFDGIDTHAELPGVQGMPALWEAFRKAGFSEDTLDRILYKNVLRLYRDTL